MRVNPRLVKQHAKQVAPLGMLLWRQLIAASSNSSSSSGTDGRLSLTPAQIRQQMSVFATHSDMHKSFVDNPDNRNLPNHLGQSCQQTNQGSLGRSLGLLWPEGASCTCSHK